METQESPWEPSRAQESPGGAQESQGERRRDQESPKVNDSSRIPLALEELRKYALPQDRFNKNSVSAEDFCNFRLNGQKITKISKILLPLKNSGCFFGGRCRLFFLWPNFGNPHCGPGVWATRVFAT